MVCTLGAPGSPPGEMVVAMRVSHTAYVDRNVHRHVGRSTRRNTMPVSARRGRSVSSTFWPLCTPTPTARVMDLRVRCCKHDFIVGDQAITPHSANRRDSRSRCSREEAKTPRTQGIGAKRSDCEIEQPRRIRRRSLGGRSAATGGLCLSPPACAGRPGSRSRPSRCSPAHPPWLPPCGHCATRSAPSCCCVVMAGRAADCTGCVSTGMLSVPVR
jgi:hypothetical protein